VWPMQEASGLSVVVEWPALRLLHRENVTRAPWGGPAARLKSSVTTSVLRTSRIFAQITAR
jgi:hypothetical protein